jgi:propanol-preferring alcohol dehydrogenase
MKAMVLERAGPVETRPLKVRDIDVPTVGDDEVLAKVEACGVCRTDLHVVEGELSHPKKLVVPGHEIVGTVVEVGRRVSRFAEGDRVGIPWLHSTCGKCEYCVTGRENLCPEKQCTGYTVDGGYAEFVTGREGFTLSLQEGDSLKVVETICPLLCAGIIGYRAFKVALPRPGGRIAIFGFGGSAHLILQVAAKMGFETVVVSRSAAHLDLARKLGASETYLAAHDALPSGKDTVQRKEGLTGKPVDSALVFAPSGSVVRDALASVKAGGIVAVAGIYVDQLPAMDYGEHLFHEKKLVSVEANTREDAEEFMRLSSKLKLRSIVSVRPLSSANEALLELKSGRVDGALVLKP